MKLSEFIKENRLYLDGAMGSELIARGLDTNQAELLNVTNPSVVREIHAAYLAAGSRLIYANTFGVNRGKLQNTAYSVKQIVAAAMENAKQAAEPFNAFVAYDAGPTGCMLEPYGDFSEEECYSWYAEQALAAAEYAPDCVVIETITDAEELRQAIRAFRENTALPVWCSMSFSASGRTIFGNSVADFVGIAEECGAEVVGINCSLGANGMLPLAKELKAAAAVPVFIKPNAGLPVFQNGRILYDTDAEAFSDAMKLIAETGISILGGCCGTTPEYIRKTVNKTKEISI